MTADSRRKRLVYALAASSVFVIEVIIALFVRDNFIRPYMGDVLVVILIYCAMKAVLPIRRRPLLPLFIFLFAVAVEVSQLFGLGDVAAARIILGGTFSWGDILCYAAGCFAAWAAEAARARKR